MIQHLVFTAAVFFAAWFAPPEGALAEKAPGASSAEARSPEGFPGIEKMFDSGQYEKASRRLNQLILDSEDMSNPKKARLYLLKARIELAFERNSEVELWLRKAYRADPSLSLDPVKDPPKLLALWKELERKLPDSSEKKKNEAPKRKATRPSTEAAAQPETKENGPARPRTESAQQAKASGSSGSSPLRLLPFGVGHFAAGDLRTGAFFLVAETSVLAVAEQLPPRPALGVRETKITTDALFGSLGLWGLYGYELAHLFHPDSPLPVFPFGVNQAIRGETQDALAFATAETLFLMAGTLSPEPSTRRLGLGLFAATWALEVVDGLAEPPAPRTKTGQASVAVVPYLRQAGPPGAQVSLQIAL